MRSQSQALALYHPSCGTEGREPLSSHHNRMNDMPAAVGRAEAAKGKRNLGPSSPMANGTASGSLGAIWPAGALPSGAQEQMQSKPWAAYESAKVSPQLFQKRSCNRRTRATRALFRRALLYRIRRPATVSAGPGCNCPAERGEGMGGKLAKQRCICAGCFLRRVSVIVRDAAVHFCLRRRVAI